MNDVTRTIEILTHDELINAVDARQLHELLEVGKDFSTWMKDQINRADFIEHEDYEVFTENGENPQGGRPRVDYALSIEAAKEICLLSQTEKGKQYRRHLINFEKEYGKQKPISKIEFFEQVLEEMKKAEAIAEEKRIQLDESKQWFTIKRVAYANGIEWKEISWKSLKDVTNAPSPKKVFDANYPNGVNAYHRDAWEKEYPHLELPESDYDENTALTLNVVR